MYGGIPLSSSLLLTSSRSGSGSAISIGNRRRGSRSFFLGFYKFFRLGLSFLEYIQFLLLVTILVYNQIQISGIDSSSRPVDYRHTTLEHTIIDVLIAAHTKHFKPSLYSSLSDLVRNYHAIGKHDWNWRK